MKKIFGLLLLTSVLAFGANQYKQPNASIFYQTLTLPKLTPAGIVVNTTGGTLGTETLLPVANGGTNSSIALNNKRLIVSNGGTIGELGTVGQSGYLLTSNGTGTLPTWQAAAGGFANPMTTTGDMIYSSSGSTATRLGIGSGNSVLTVSGGIPIWSPTVTNSKAPTIQVLTSGSGTYTLPTNPSPQYIVVTMIGGGGGGAGSGASAGTAANAGGNTNFGGAGFIQAGGGPGGQFNTNAPIGGTNVTAGGNTIVNVQGGYGGNGGQAAVDSGGHGCVSPFGGAGAGGYGDTNTAGFGAIVNSGSGGGGGSSTAVAGDASGGACGGYVISMISSPSSTYSYNVGGSGTAGGAGPSGNAGGAGGSGVIIVQEFYPSLSVNNGATTAIVSNTTKASFNSVYLVNTSGNTVAMTMPNPSSFPAYGSAIEFKDRGGTFQTNNLTIGPFGSESFDGVAGNFVVKGKYQDTKWVTDGTNWFSSSVPENLSARYTGATVTATLSAGGTLAGTGLFQLQYTTKDFDDNSSYNATGGIYTCPVTGKYEVTASVGITAATASAAAFASLYTQLAGAIHAGQTVWFATAATKPVVPVVSDMVNCTSGQTISTAVNISAGTTPSIASSLISNFIWIRKLGN